MKVMKRRKKKTEDTFVKTTDRKRKNGDMSERKQEKVYIEWKANKRESKENKRMGLKNGEHVERNKRMIKRM